MVTAYCRDLVVRAVPGERTVAYYPGIGGGNEPIDVMSAFSQLGVDEVIGVDLQTSKRPADLRVDAGLEEAVEKYGYDIKLLSADASSGEFEFDGKTRKLTVVKADAHAFIPHGEIPRIIYQRRETSLIPRLPLQVVDAAKLIYGSDDNSFLPKAAAAFGLQHGFIPVDMGYLFRTLDKGRKQIYTYWEGNPQLLVRPDLQKPARSKSSPRFKLGGRI